MALFELSLANSAGRGSPIGSCKPLLLFAGNDMVNESFFIENLSYSACYGKDELVLSWGLGRFK